MHEFESVLMRWVNLEPVSQSEVSRKRKQLYTNTHISGIQKDGTIYVESRKKNLFAGQQWRNRHREQTYGHGVREDRVRCVERVTRRLTSSSKIDSQREFAGCLGEPKQGLCINLAGWDGEGGGRAVHEGGDICTPMADSGWCLTENNKILQSNYPSIKKKRIKFFLKN